MGKSQREKGKRGEREWAAKCREHGYDCRRGVQYCGKTGQADVVGLPYIHQEVKRVERLNIIDAMSQSKSDAKEGEIPIVAHRRDNGEWLVTMQADLWFDLYREYEVMMALKPVAGCTEGAK